MKHVKTKVFMALCAMAISMTTQAAQVNLTTVGLRAASGTYYSLFFNGSDGGPVSTATWDWSGGVLTMTSGFLYATQRVGATALLSDVVTGLIIDTNLGTTTATSYQCIEGAFGLGTGANSCANTSFGDDFVNNTTVSYDVGGDASCAIRNIGGDDSSGTPPVFRGLRSWAGGGVNGCGDNTGRGALDMITIIQDNTGFGGSLILANFNGTGAIPAACLVPGANPGDSLGCNRAHWLVFSSPIPVPAAVWLFGSALGVLGWTRRRSVTAT
ncbi:MAG: hypothetical protein JNK40_00580 [Chromatiales bacterium]|nr:hypothetical protein [Chromatiales bacterium]